MTQTLEEFNQVLNNTQYRGQKGGFYESFYQRANHPTKPEAFWIRYTLFSPKKNPKKTIGELWAIYFNGKTNEHVALKKELPFSKCKFSNDKFYAKIGSAFLRTKRLKGSITSKDQSLAWDLDYLSDQTPLLLTPYEYIHKRFPAAKVVVSSPLASYTGLITVSGKKIMLKNWLGSQNHNWGSRHTDEYAYVQVAGFDGHPETFLEGARAKLKLFGPLWTPAMSPIVLRHEGREYAFNQLLQTIRNKGSFRYFHWEFKAENSELRVEGTVKAPPEAFVGLTYYNPPGGNKHCLNTKIGYCELKLTHKKRKRKKTETLVAKNRALFEIVTSDRGHGIPISV